MLFHAIIVLFVAYLLGFGSIYSMIRCFKRAEEDVSSPFGLALKFLMLLLSAFGLLVAICLAVGLPILVLPAP